MKEIIIDGEVIENLNDIHYILKSELNFPEYYGMNLDALHDCLTDLNEDVQIDLLSTDMLSEKLGRRYPRFLKMLCDTSEENDHLMVKAFVK